MNRILISNISICLMHISRGALRSFAVCAFFMLLALAGRAQQTTGSQLPAGFPVYKDTGNAKEDNKRYEEEKKAWIEANKEVYFKITGESKLPVWDAVTMPAASNALEDKTNVAPEAASWPVMIPPYNPMQQPTPVVTEALPTATEMQSTQQTQELQIMPPHYPVVQKTGNVAVDEQNHIAAKNKWIAEYPEEYQKVGGNLQAWQKNTTTIETKSTDKPKPVLPVFEAQKKYKLIVYEAVAAENQKVNLTQLKEETENITKKDFLGTRTELQISGNEIRLYEPEKIDLRATEKRNGKKVEWFFENKECAACSKTLYLTIEQETDQGVSYIMQSEDEGDVFAYRLLFELIINP